MIMKERILFISNNDLFDRLEATKSDILPELVELTNDEESNVRINGLSTVVNVLSLLDDGQ